MSKTITTTIEHPAHITVYTVRTEYELNMGSVQYQSFIESSYEGESGIENDYREFLKPKQEKYKNQNEAMCAVFAQHHKIEVLLWAINYEPVVLYGLRHPIIFHSFGNDVEI